MNTSYRVTSETVLVALGLVPAAGAAESPKPEATPELDTSASGLAATILETSGAR